MPLNYFSRGGLWNERQQNLYRMLNGSFYSISPDGAKTSLGAVTGNGQCSLPYSFNTQAIIGDGKYFLYDPVNGFRQVTDPDLGNPIDAVWVDGYYFFTDGEYLYHTDIANESSIDPLKFATSEFSPDPTIGVGLTTDNKVMAFNRYTIEYFINQANENFAFSRLSSRTVSAGTVGTYAKTQINGTWYIMGGAKDSDISIYVVGTGSVLPIASREVSKIISSYTETQLTETVLESRTVDGYPYLIVHLPNQVLMFNLKLAELSGIDQAWSLLVSDTNNTPYRAINGVFDPRRGQWVYGDKYTTKLAFLDATVATHYGDIAEWTIYTPFTYLETASVDELSVETIPGFTTTSDATVFIALTYDGINYSMEHSLMYGLPSKYNQRFGVYRLGYIDNYFSMRLRGASRSRMAFAAATIVYG